MIVVLLLLLSFGRARAGDIGAGCGSTSYTRTAVCKLVFRGFPVTVFGDAQVTSGTADLEVHVTIEELGDVSPTIFSCTADQPAKFESCSKGLPDNTTTVDNTLLQQFHLRCTVTSRGTGQYRCVSGSGR